MSKKIQIPLNEGQKAFRALSAEIESSLTPNRCCDADTLAKSIDDLIIQRITDYHKANANRSRIFR